MSASQTQSSQVVPSAAVTTATVVSNPTGCTPESDGGVVVVDDSTGADPGACGASVDVEVASATVIGSAPESLPLEESGDAEQAANRSTAAKVHRTLRRLRGVGDDVVSGHDL